ncbi:MULTISPECIES: NUDIX domain-containing protein [unclassified Variovorax]|uniref:NUDIX domain-containing protein n=1 Tax=unclassified Variovorax TaxID=663243 RepID=UPI001BD66053|nr:MULTISPECIES: NUDIX domain-containing protein [unclassified Variovorax]
MQAPTSAINSPAPQTPSTPRPIRAAATLLVLRDGRDGLEVLLLRRAEKANDQNSGASVFPGGMLDAHDRSLHGHCTGLDDTTASARLSVSAGGLDYYAAAVRECFEEAGVLFASDASGKSIDLAALPAQELDAMRHAAAQGTDALLALCDQRGWRLAVDRLAYFAHWLTPPGMPRRFDTRFFAALMPPAQVVSEDGLETVEHMWLRPADALAPARGLKLMNVTRRILQQLDAFGSAGDCLAHARSLQQIPLNMPRLAQGPQGQRAVNIEEPAYEELGHVDPDGQCTGRYALEAGLAMRLSPQVWRVTDSADGTPTAPGLNSYFIGEAGGDCALIDPMPAGSAHFAALRSAAPGPVRWILSTGPRGSLDAATVEGLRAAWPEARPLQASTDEVLKVGGTTIRAVVDAEDADALAFLLVEERLLFTGSGATVPAHMRDSVDWIVPAQGFMRRRAR